MSWLSFDFPAVVGVVTNNSVTDLLLCFYTHNP